MNLQSKFGYCIITQTLNIALCKRDGTGRNYGRTNRQTDKQTDGRTDDPNTRCPRRTFQAGGIKIVRQPRQNTIALLDDVTVIKRFKIVRVAWFTFSRFHPIGMKQCMFWADVNT